MKLYKPKCINENIVIIDGLTRSGKFYLGKLVSSIVGLEYFINSSEVERVIMAGLTGVVTPERASALMAIAVNEEIYNRAIGRDMNLRSDDASSILNSYEKENYLVRQENKPGWEAVNKILDNKRHSVFILHQSLQALEIIKGAIPKPSIINIRRHPIDLAFSWVNRGWGHRYESGDPLTFEPIFHHSGTLVPYFAVDWCDEYVQSNEYDRVVKSIIHLIEKESKAIRTHEDQMCHVYYDNLIRNPEKELNKICAFLRKEPHESMTGVIKKETTDVNMLSNRIEKEDKIYRNMEDQDALKKLKELSKNYEGYIQI